MNEAGQGVLRLNKLVRLLIHLLLTLNLCYLPVNAAESIITTSAISNTTGHRVFINYSRNNSLHTRLKQNISENLKLKHPEIVISNLAEESKDLTPINDSDIIVSIGLTNNLDTINRYPDTTRLFISTDPEKFKLDSAPETAKNSSILYMTQSYCRQMQFIKSIDANWKVVGLLNSQTKKIDSVEIQQCAKEYDLTTYSVTTENTETLSDALKDVLTNSDVLLALPDHSIYNSNTVKNILLTSYRYRKPVIAFSRNFVNAGALAAVYSSIDQVAASAISIIERYYEQDQHFERAINHPQSFNIQLNRQVFKALAISLPDVDRLKQTLDLNDENKPGKVR